MADIIPTPTVVGISVDPPEAVLTPGQGCAIYLMLSVACTVAGTPRLVLSNGGRANFIEGNNTDRLRFWYVAGEDQAAEAVRVTGIDLNGGQITHAVLNIQPLGEAMPEAQDGVISVVAPPAPEPTPAPRVVSVTGLQSDVVTIPRQVVTYMVATSEALDIDLGGGAPHLLLEGGLLAQVTRDGNSVIWGDGNKIPFVLTVAGALAAPPKIVAYVPNGSVAKTTDGVVVDLAALVRSAIGAVPIPTPTPTPLPPTPEPTPVPTPVPTPPPPAPVPPPPVPTGDLGSVTFVNTTGSPSATQYVTFGHVFPRAAMPHGSASSDAQIDVDSRWDDGSLKRVRYTVRVPSLPAGSQTVYPLALPTAVGLLPPLEVPTAGGAYNVGLRLAMADGANKTLWLSDLMMDQTNVTYWRRGPLVTELRAWARVAGSLRVIADVSFYADGSWEMDLQVRNDVANQAYGAPVTYSAQIESGGAIVYTTPQLVHRQYQGWRHLVRSNPMDAPLHVKHDIAALQRAGAVMPFNLANPSDVSRDWLAMMASPSWRAPFGANGVAQYMPMTGARVDIGPTTAQNAIWLMRQSPAAQELALGQCEASMAVPWNAVDATGRPLMLGVNVSGQFWTDGRASDTLKQQPDYAGTGWNPDSAHQPNLSYHAALLTGRRWCLDQLQAQATWQIVSEWPDPRAFDKGLVVGWFPQVRQKAWNLREVAMAAYLSPSDSEVGIYLNRILRSNVDYLVGKLPQWTSEQGDIHGYILGAGRDGHVSAWQTDYLYSTITMMARMGVDGADNVRAFMRNFVVQRHLRCPPEMASVYDIPVNPGGVYIKTWEDLNATMASPAWEWEKTSPTYPQGSYMSVCLSAGDDAAAAAARLVAAWDGRPGSIGTDRWLHPAEVDKLPHFDMRPAAA